MKPKPYKYRSGNDGKTHEFMPPHPGYLQDPRWRKMKDRALASEQQRYSYDEDEQPTDGDQDGE